MARRTVLLLPLPADVEDVAQVLEDVGRGWAAAKIEQGPSNADGESTLRITASRRRAQRPAPDEEPEDEPTYDSTARVVTIHPEGRVQVDGPLVGATSTRVIDLRMSDAEPGLVRTVEPEPPLSGPVTPPDTYQEPNDDPPPASDDSLDFAAGLGR